MIRRYNKDKDFEAATELLKRENVVRTALNRGDGVTFVLEKNKELLGFFTLSYMKKIPTLQHFVVRKTARNKKSDIGFVSKNALNLVRFLDHFIKHEGYLYFIINLKKRKPLVCKVVERYFKTRIKGIKETQKGLKLYLIKGLL